MTGPSVAVVGCAVAVAVGGTVACAVAASDDTVSNLNVGVSVSDEAIGRMRLSSTAGAEVEATAFDSKPEEGVEAGVSTSGGLFRSGPGGASAAGLASAVESLTFCSGVIILVQGGSAGHTKGIKSKK